jgi:hypothetical protein
MSDGIELLLYRKRARCRQADSMDQTPPDPASDAILLSGSPSRPMGPFGPT